MRFPIITALMIVSDIITINTPCGLWANIVKPKLWHVNYGTFLLCVLCVTLNLRDKRPFVQLSVMSVRGVHPVGRVNGFVLKISNLKFIDICVFKIHYNAQIYWLPCYATCLPWQPFCAHLVAVLSHVSPQIWCWCDHPVLSYCKFCLYTLLDFVTLTFNHEVMSCDAICVINPVPDLNWIHLVYHSRVSATTVLPPA